MVPTFRKGKTSEDVLSYPGHCHLLKNVADTRKKNNSRTFASLCGHGWGFSLLNSGWTLISSQLQHTHPPRVERCPWNHRLPQASPLPVEMSTTISSSTFRYLLTMFISSNMGAGVFEQVNGVDLGLKLESSMCHTAQHSLSRWGEEYPLNEM